jgi:hypothetical protein
MRGPKCKIVSLLVTELVEQYSFKKNYDPSTTKIQFCQQAVITKWFQNIKTYLSNQYFIEFRSNSENRGKVRALPFIEELLQKILQ